MRVHVFFALVRHNATRVLPFCIRTKIKITSFRYLFVVFSLISLTVLDKDGIGFILQVSKESCVTRTSKVQSILSLGNEA